jgi:hypothetical protein
VREGTGSVKIELAMILSAVIGAGVSLLTIVITRLFDFRSARKKEKERFFYEIYTRRLALYEEILTQVWNFTEATFGDASESIDEFGKAADAFFGFTVRCELFAGIAVTATLKEIDKLLRSLVDEFGPGTVSDPERIRTVFYGVVVQLKEKMAFLRTQIRSETCPGLVDRFLSRFAGKSFKNAIK